MATQTQISAGTEAKKVGHIHEQMVCDWLNSVNEGHYVDGKTKTKRDIVNSKTGISYSLKSVSKKHTQCHLTSAKRWCEFFDIQDDTRLWFDLFFGVPGKDVSNGQNRHHRLTKSDIDDYLNNLGLEWFNHNKNNVFDVIIRRGMYSTPVDYLIWLDKPTGKTQVYDVNQLEKLIDHGVWIMNETTLHFMNTNDEKMFHLQMKGSGTKYTSGYHSMMFHIYKCF
jgi:hypothetical protein